MNAISKGRSLRRLIVLGVAGAAVLVPTLPAPAEAQGLLRRLGRTIERLEQKTADIENKAAVLERSVTQVKQAADGLDRTADTAGALLGGDQADMAGDTGAMQPAEAWQAEEGAMMPGQPLGVAAEDTPQPLPQDRVAVSKKEPRQ